MRGCTGIAVLRTSSVDYPDEKAFPAKFREVHEKMACVKASSPASIFSAGMPFWNPCAACGLYPASTRSLFYEREECELICYACSLREKASDRYELGGARELPDDFDDIGSKSKPLGYLALI